MPGPISRTINVGMIGCGTVGTGVAKLLIEQAELYHQRLGATLVLRRILVRNPSKISAACVVNPQIVTSDPAAFFADNSIDIYIEVAGGIEPIASYVKQALTKGKPVITANKALLADQGPELFALARKHNTCVAFEASCGGGIPIITATQFGLMANRIDALYGILNGTCNYILTEMTTKAKAYATALKEAQDAGYAEADPTLDVSGRDTAQKLAVLASLAFGAKVKGDQVWSEGIDKLELADIRFGAELGYDIKLLAIAERAKKADGSADSRVSLRVHPSFISNTLPLSRVAGSFNAVSVFGQANGHTMYYGRGAGQLPTASAIVSDLLNVASGWYQAAFNAMNIWSDKHESIQLIPADDLVSRYYVRMNAMDVPGVMAKVSSILGESNISLSAILQHETNAGQFVPLVITTHQARQGDIQAALSRIGKLSVIQGPPVCIRIVDLPQG